MNAEAQATREMQAARMIVKLARARIKAAGPDVSDQAAHRILRKAAIQVAAEVAPKRAAQIARFPGPRAGEAPRAYAQRVQALLQSEHRGPGRPARAQGASLAMIACRVDETEQAQIGAWCAGLGFANVSEGIRYALRKCGAL